MRKMGECLLKGEVNQPNPILLQATVENLQGKCRKGLPLVIKKLLLLLACSMYCVASFLSMLPFLTQISKHLKIN